MSRARFTFLASVLAVLIFLIGNALSHRVFASARLDLTERGLFTLNEGTVGTLRTLGEPVELTFVYSRSLGTGFPAIRAHAERVREMLAAYASTSGGRVRVREIEPAPFSEAEDLARAAGITGLPTDGSDLLYFGIVGRNLADDERVIPFLSPDQDSSLEYDLTRLVIALDRPEPPRVGVLTSLPAMKGDGRETGYRVLRDLAGSFRIVEISERFVTLPADLDVLLLAHPPLLDERQFYMIDQFLMSGGRMVVFIDPASKAALASGSVFDERVAPAASNLDRILAPLGITLTDGVIGDRELALPVRVPVSEGRSVVVNQPLFFAIPPERMNPTSSATAELGRAVNVGAPGGLDISRVDGVATEILLTSSPEVSRLPADLALDDATPAAVLAEFRDEGRPIPVALALTAETSSAFAGRVEPVMPDDPVLAELVRIELANPAPHLNRSEKPFRIIVVADTDLLDDGFHVDPQSGQTAADNSAFVLNAVQMLSGDIDLNALRARAPALRPMSRVEALREAAQTEFFAEQNALQAQLELAEQRAEDLRARGAGSDYLDATGALDISPEERAELETLRAEILSARARLRAIEADFRRDIDRLESGLKLLNIWLMPGLVFTLGMGVFALRRRRRARS